MKSEEELDALLDEVNRREPERAAELEVIDSQGLIDTKLLVLLDMIRKRIADVEEAEGLSAGRLGQRARRNTKNNLIDAARKLDKQLAKVIARHGLRDEVERRKLGGSEEQESSGVPIPAWWYFWPDDADPVYLPEKRSWHAGSRRNRRADSSAGCHSSNLPAREHAARASREESYGAV